MPLLFGSKTFTTSVLTVLLVSGCGVRGPLVLPPGPAPEPLLSSTKSVPASLPVPRDEAADASTPSPTKP